MAWRRPGNKLLSEQMMFSSLTQICITRPEWVKTVIILTNTEGGTNDNIHCSPPTTIRNFYDFKGFTQVSLYIIHTWGCYWGCMSLDAVHISVKIISWPRTTRKWILQILTSSEMRINIWRGEYNDLGLLFRLWITLTSISHRYDPYSFSSTHLNNDYTKSIANHWSFGSAISQVSILEGKYPPPNHVVNNATWTLTNVSRVHSP